MDLQENYSEEPLVENINGKQNMRLKEKFQTVLNQKK